MVANVPDYVRPDLDRARDLEQLNRFAEAIEVYRGVIGRYPEIAVLHNGLGCAFANLGKRDQAAIEFREAIRLTALNRQQGLVTPRTYPQEPEQNLRAVLGKTLPGRVDSRYLMMLKLFLVPVYALVAAIVYTVYLRLSGKPWGDSYAYVQARQLWFLPIGALFSFEPSDFRLRNGMFLLDRGGFAFSDLIPLIKVWNHANRRYLNRLLWVGLLCGASVGYYLARARGWPGAAYYAFFWALSVESFMFVLGLQFCQRRQEDETTWKVRPVLKIMYWLFFALIADVPLRAVHHGAILPVTVPQVVEGSQATGPLDASHPRHDGKNGQEGSASRSE